MTNNRDHMEFISTKQFLEDVWDDYLDREKDPEKYRPIDPIVPELAEQFGGYLAGQFGVWGAPPKGGKSAALMSSATHIMTPWAGLVKRSVSWSL